MKTEMTTEEKYELLRCLLDLGEMLLESGAEIDRIEDTIIRMSKAYGAERTDVFVITSIISITLVFGDGYTATETRRVANEANTDFRRIESVNSLSRACCMDPLPVNKLRKRVNQVAEGHKSYAAILTGSILAAAGFAVFFGGSIADGAIAALFASIIAAAQKQLSTTRIKTMPSVVPLVPGGPLYYAMSEAVRGNMQQAGAYGRETLLFALAIASGICLVTAVRDLKHR